MEVMKAWFEQNYEDPVHRTPYQTSEGGYQWIHGGPYYAQEELMGEFEGLASEKMINDLVEELEHECTEWTSAPDRDDYYDEGYVPVGIDDIVDGDGEWPPLILDGGAESDKLDGGIERDPLDEIQGLINFGITPKFGSPEELSARKAVVSSLDEIETALTALEPDQTASLIGHNHPPEPIEQIEERVSRAEIKAEIRAAVAELKAEFKADTPNVPEVITLAKRLKNSLFKVTGWIATKGVESLIMGAGAVIATQAADGKLSQLADGLTSAGSAVIAWLKMVMSTPF
ncbi:hypothetical protein D2T81_00810 [Azospirillum brasilense]|nr:hypothetical protein D2T81_00810 [Azospirillum brasilense]